MVLRVSRIFNGIKGIRDILRGFRGIRGTRSILGKGTVSRGFCCFGSILG